VALDYLMKTAETVHDISDNVLKSAVAVNLGKTGLIDKLACTVFITEVSAQAVNPVIFNFEYTLDNGANWYRHGSGTVKTVAAKTMISFPVGFGDLVPELVPEADIDWRVTSQIPATVANADDFAWQAYLGEHQGYGVARAVL
jgi:hypothetical protein